VNAPFVVIAGNIGVGKSTLVAQLAQRWGWRAAHEPNADNPYLADFYHDMPAWAFHSQVFFLTRRLEQHNRICAEQQPTLQDRSVYEDAEIFARALRAAGHLSGRDWTLYFDLYSTMAQIIRAPDLVVYLRASLDTLQTRIALRGRDYERGIQRNYLERLNDLYDNWSAGFSRAPLCTIEVDGLDWSAANDQASGLGQIADQIQQALKANR
jgi:deoxyadenosine/deoxycytidine kinase